MVTDSPVHCKVLKSKFCMESLTAKLSAKPVAAKPVTAKHVAAKPVAAKHARAPKAKHDMTSSSLI